MKLFANNPLTITQTEQKLLENDIVDIEQWLRDALKGKINQCKKRFLNEWHIKLINDPNITTIPANIDDFVKLVLNHPQYKNRIERENLNI